MTTLNNRGDRKVPVVILLAAAFGLGFAGTAGVDAKPTPAPFDYSDLRMIPIFHDDRAKPLDSFARETMRLMTGREYWSKKKAPHPWLSRDPITNLLSMLFEGNQEETNWQTIPAIHVDNADVKEVLGMESKDEWISYTRLRENRGFQEAMDQIRKKYRESEDGKPELTNLERKVSELHGVLNHMDGVFFGTSLRVVPVENAAGHPQWASLSEMAEAGEDEKLRGLLYDLMVGYSNAQPRSFEKAAGNLKEELRKRRHEVYPTEAILSTEITYNQFKPFRKSWGVLLAASILFAVSMGVKSRIPYLLGWAFFLGGFSLSAYGLLLRVIIANRPPVSNMYESVVYMGWGVLLFAGIFELIYRKRIFGLCGSIMGVVVLVMADLLPFDPEISPLVPVLRSSYWLIIHVMTIVISYSAFALAMIIGHFALCFYLFAPGKKDIIATANMFLYRAIQIGVLLLAAGTILGGVWANESWGRFWGWDPKETWAFISLMGYLALLHARYTTLIGPFGTAVGSILGFMLILMTWYGVNFILGTGLHSYGFGTGGEKYVIGFVAGEILFMTFVAVCYKLLYRGGDSQARQPAEPVAGNV